MASQAVIALQKIPRLNFNNFFPVYYKSKKNEVFRVI